ncbi:MAG: winged helix-turn-helix domain-containing protein, partial [Anaerolineales bacterium]|nr:winged helix-turn-helix domain-containing protein [Anaerolineales bacterium]
MSRLNLTLLGPFQAEWGGTAVPFPTDKVRALLAYLAVEQGRPHRREALAALLWPEQPDAQARRNLRLTLHRLKQALDAADAADAADKADKADKADGGAVSDGLLAVSRATVQWEVGAAGL